MKRIVLLAAFTFSAVSHANLSAMSLTEAQELLKQPSTQEVQQVLESAPTNYNFSNEAGESTVNYSEAVMHQVFINDSKLIFGSFNRGQFAGQFDSAYKKLNSYYAYDGMADSLIPTLVSAHAENGGEFSLYEGKLYGDIYPGVTDVKTHLAGFGDAAPRPVLGWNTPVIEGVKVDSNNDGVFTANELYEAFMTVIANNAASSSDLVVENGSLESQKVLGAHVTASGLDLAQMSQKLLHGALSLYQATDVLLGLNPTQGAGILADNQNFVELQDFDGVKNFTTPYTQLQHQWDMALGYFGAARNYLEYSDKQIAGGFSLDAYAAEDVETDDGDLAYFNQIYGEQDFEVSLQSEKNMGLAINAAKRAMKAKLLNEDFGIKIMEAFLKGRQLLQTRPAGYRERAQAYAIVAAYEWERVIAATVVHYINETLADYEAYGTADYAFTNLAKHYGEMKGFALDFQYNPTSAMDQDTFVKMHKLFGDAPMSPASSQIDSYKADLLEARDLIAKAYSFDQENVKAW